MQIEHLEEFVLLVETRSFSEAAKLVHITQPAFSKHIKAVEQEVGADLVKREGGALELTSEGESLYRDALSLVDLYQNALRRIHDIRDNTRPVVSVGYFYEAAKPLLAPMRQWYKKNRPAVLLNMKSRDIDELWHDFQTKGFDAIIAPIVNPALVSGYESMRLYSVPLLCAVHWSHPLSALDAVAPEMLASENLNVPDPQKWPLISNYVESRLGGTRAWREASHAVESNTLFDLIESNSAVAIVAGYNKYVHTKGVSYIPLDDPRQPSIDVALLWPSSQRDDVERIEVVEDLRCALGESASLLSF